MSSLRHLTCRDVRYLSWSLLLSLRSKNCSRSLRPGCLPIVVTRDVLRFEDGDDLMRSRIDDEDLVADQDVAVASPLGIDYEHFRR